MIGSRLLVLLVEMHGSEAAGSSLADGKWYASSVQLRNQLHEKQAGSSVSSPSQFR